MHKGDLLRVPERGADYINKIEVLKGEKTLQAAYTEGAIIDLTNELAKATKIPAKYLNGEIEDKKIK